MASKRTDPYEIIGRQIRAIIDRDEATIADLQSRGYTVLPPEGVEWLKCPMATLRH